MQKSFLVSSLMLVVAVGLSACAGTRPRPLSADARAQLDRIEHGPVSTGEQIYEGRVFALDGRTDALFTYERRVRQDGGLTTSTHITHDPSGAVVVVQRASHTSTYDLRRADLLHGQSGVTASVVIVGSEAIYTLHNGVRTTTSREAVADPVVAGPTLFGFILAHWEALTGGATIPIRFAVLERGESLGFVLASVNGPQGRTIIRMTPSNPLVRLAVSPTYFQFDTRSRQILEYTGRVPPFERRGDTLATLEARVAYQFVAPTFR